MQDLFDWDEDKNNICKSKHRVGFEVASVAMTNLPAIEEIDNSYSTLEETRCMRFCQYRLKDDESGEEYKLDLAVVYIYTVNNKKYLITVFPVDADDRKKWINKNRSAKNDYR